MDTSLNIAWTVKAINTLLIQFHCKQFLNCCGPVIQKGVGGVHLACGLSVVAARYQLGVHLSEISVGLAVQDASLTWLATDVTYFLRGHLRLLTERLYVAFLAWWLWDSQTYFMVSGFCQRVSQEDQTEAIQPSLTQVWRWHPYTSLYWLEQPKFFCFQGMTYRPHCVIRRLSRNFGTMCYIYHTGVNISLSYLGNLFIY